MLYIHAAIVLPEGIFGSADTFSVVNPAGWSTSIPWVNAPMSVISWFYMRWRGKEEWVEGVGRCDLPGVKGLCRSVQMMTRRAI